MKLVIKNKKGEEIVLNQREAVVANFIQRHVNSLGYEVDITTLTTVMKSISEQKFYQIPFANYVPVKVGEGAWTAQLTKYLSYDLAGDFEQGVLNTGGSNARMGGADTGISSLSTPVINWAKAVAWTIMDLQTASKSGNWDLVTSKEKARKKNWDLGLQKLSMVGLSGSEVKGLLNQSGVTTNTDFISGPISTMAPTDLKAFTAGLVTLFRNNCSRTAMPKRLIVPESDFNGMASVSSPDFPLKSVKQVLEESFKVICGEEFQILPLSYCDEAYNSLLSGVNQYVLHSNDEDSLQMNIPVDYTPTVANSFDNFNFQNVGYGQFTGVQVYRPAELMYFTASVVAE